MRQHNGDKPRASNITGGCRAKRMKSQKVCEPAFQANVAFTTSHFLLVQKKTPFLIFLQLCLLSKLPNHHSIVNAGGVDVPKRMLSKYKL